jgi:hypothetical protein
VRALLDWTLPQISAGARGQSDNASRPEQSAPAALPIPAQSSPHPQSDRTALRADDEPEAADTESPTPEADAVDRTPAAGSPAVEAPATVGALAPSHGDSSTPERPTPVARHSRVTAPSGRR